VADAKNNTTRFSSFGAQAEMGEPVGKRRHHDLRVQVRNIPGALQGHGGFRTTASTYQASKLLCRRSFAATQFYADVQGHPHIAR